MGLKDIFHHDSAEKKAHDEVERAPHKAALSHELIASAASYAAAKAYEEHCAKVGKPTTHAHAVELLAGLAGGAVDRLIETKGLDAVDRAQAKRKAKADAERYLEHHDQDVAPAAIAPDVGVPGRQ